MVLTLFEFLKFCKNALNIYDVRIEENGMDGDVEISESYTAARTELNDCIATVSMEYQTNKILTPQSIMDWLFLEENSKYRVAFLDALNIIKEDSQLSIQKLKNDLSFSDMFLGLSQSESLFSLADKENKE